ncbi:hypothetical protein, partial [Pseudoflavonifractor sp. MSJ-37]|uniref:hypothetical protein n=1 Tax=Pseudoflavonifractor sp. MSJ-37 TaxID=2841531 RepID=UPI001C0F80EA
AGRGDGTFAPSANVTGSEAAKMLLVALGYNTKYEGIGGATWQTTTDVLANLAGLYDELEDMNTSNPLTRDNAAQMIYNALNANVVSYSWTYNANGTAVAVQNKSDDTMLEDKFGVVTVEGIVVANEYADIENGGDALKEGKTTIDVTNHEKGQDNYDGISTFNVSSGRDELGRAVTLYVKPSTTAAKSADKGTVIGSVVVTSENTVVEDSSRDSLKDVASDNKLSYVSTGTNKTQVSENYNATRDITTSDISDDGYRGEVRVLIDNDDDSKVDYVIYETYELGKVTKYSTKDDGSIILNGTSSLSFDDKDDVVGFENVAKNDYVMYAVIGGKLYVSKAESVTGELTAYKADGAKSTLTVDGTKYNASGLNFYSDGNTLTSAQGYSTLKKEATFYLDLKGNVIAVDGTNATNNYAFLIKAGLVGGASDDVQVKVALDDGTTKTYTLSDDSVGVNKDSVNTLCTYTVSDDEITLEAVDAEDVDNDNITIKKGNATVTGISGAYADSSTVYFYVAPKGAYDAATKSFTDLSVDEVDVYVGKDKVSGLEFKNTDKTDYKYFTKDGDIKAVVVVTDGTKSASNYIYLYEKLGKNSDGYLYNAIVDGKIVKDVVVTTDKANETLYPYTLTSKGFYKVGGELTDKGNVTRIDGDSVIIGGTEYKLTKDTVIANIDGGDTELESVINEGDYVAFKANSDKDLEAVFVTLPYDASKTAITVDKDAANTANVTVTVSGDIITIGGTNKASLTGTTLAGILKGGSNTAVAVYEDDGATAVTGSNVADDYIVTVTYTKSGTSKTMVDTYTIVIA